MNEWEKTSWECDYLRSYISRTRYKGFCTLLFLIKNDENKWDLHYFDLKFNHLGIQKHSYYPDLSRQDLADIVESKDLYPLYASYAKLILRDAYLQTCRYRKKLPGDVNLYLDLLRFEGYDKYKSVVFKLQENLLAYPLIIDVYLLAFKNSDLALIYDLATKSLKDTYGERELFIKEGSHILQQYNLLKSEIVKFQKEGVHSIIEVELVVTDDEGHYKKINIEFKIIKKCLGYLIEGVQVKKILVIEADDPLNPLNYSVYTKVYEISDYQAIKGFFEKNKNMCITGELEGQTHYKWFEKTDNFEISIDIADNIYGEFILMNKKLIIYSKKLEDLSEICFYLKKNLKQGSMSFFSKIKCNMSSISTLVLEDGKRRQFEILRSQNSYIIAEGDYGRWHTYCLQNCCKHYFNKKMRLFILNYGDSLIEIIFYKNNGIINLFNNNLDQVRKELNFPQKRLYNIRKLITGINLTRSENWSNLKIIKELNDNKLTKVYKNSHSVKELAVQYDFIK